MKKNIIYLASFLFLVIFTNHCLSFTDSYYSQEKWEAFQSKSIPDWRNCDSDNLEYTLFRILKKQVEFECTTHTKVENYRIHWVKSSFESNSFIPTWSNLRTTELFPIVFLAWVGLIPNYHEKKINIEVKVYSPRGLLWKKDYYSYYDTWTSIVLLPFMPVQYFLNDENVEDTTILSLLERMTNDLRIRELLGETDENYKGRRTK